MRRFIFNVFLTLAFSLSYFSVSDAYEKEIKALSSALAESIVTSGKKSVAVVDFTDLQGNVTELGRFLAEEFSASLSEFGRGFDVVDRTHLKSLLKEHQLALTGLIDPKTARKLGEIAGVQGLITGTLTPFGDSIRLSVKVLDTATAKVIGSSRGDIAKTKAIEELLAKGIDVPPAISPQLPATPSISPISSQKSKNVGNIIVTVKKIAASQNQIDLALDFYNKSDRELKLALTIPDRATLVDDKGNRFNYSGGLVEVETRVGEMGWKRTMEDAAPTLFSRTNNDVVLKFYPINQINLRDLGSKFDLSINFALYDPKSRSLSTHQTSFSDIPK